MRFGRENQPPSTGALHTDIGFRKELAHALQEFRQDRKRAAPQTPSASSAITGLAPAPICANNAVLSGRSFAMKKRAVASLAL